jgi:hypothetical protein
MDVASKVFEVFISSPEYHQETIENHLHNRLNPYPCMIYKIPVRIQYR